MGERLLQACGTAKILSRVKRRTAEGGLTVYSQSCATVRDTLSANRVEQSKTQTVNHLQQCIHKPVLGVQANPFPLLLPVPSCCCVVSLYLNGQQLFTFGARPPLIL